ncbi:MULTISPECIES: Wzz/FepE/Etk N-terminal domain-containing protein [unclassified Pseudoalteromonas]|uniref:Wzz/FepE/Etk N-terminal domain-containing protein n=1 Tax=unclassified Pseudoalteromonas TaxID=194690 RepID=UPI001E4D6C9A|nr:MULTISPECIES: Wzz/FepE/Etk N-terminal domain-containing protein [unclassified Pseudoalteromonas]
MRNKMALDEQSTLVETKASLDDEIDLRELFITLWKEKFKIIFISIIFTTFSVVYSLSLPNIYKSEVLLTSAEQDSGGGLSSIVGQLGGIASLPGVKLGDNAGSNSKLLAIEILKSRQFSAEFIQNHNILADLMAAKSWNLASNKITYDSDIYDHDTDTWIREVSLPFKARPSPLEAHEIFKDIVNISENEVTGMLILSVKHISPYIAKQWADWLVEDINKVMKVRDVSEAEKSTAFLVEQLKETNISDMKSVLYRLIEEQAKTIMFANVRDEYVFKTVDAAIVPEKKAEPSRALICILGALLGGIIGVFIVSLRYLVKGSEKRSSNS